MLHLHVTNAFAFVELRGCIASGYPKTFRLPVVQTFIPRKGYILQTLLPPYTVLYPQ